MIGPKVLENPTLPQLRGMNSAGKFHTPMARDDSRGRPAIGVPANRAESLGALSGAMEPGISGAMEGRQAGSGMPGRGVCRGDSALLRTHGIGGGPIALGRSCDRCESLCRTD